MVDIGLRQPAHVPQTFLQKEKGRLVLIVAKFADDLKAAGDGDRVKKFMEKFDRRFKFGDVKHGPGKYASLVSTLLKMATEI